MARSKKKGASADAAPAPKTAIKVLRGGASWHGGDHHWSLPTQAADGSWSPGEWTPSVKRPKLCSTGYHLTTEPARWWGEGDVVAYLAEHDGAVDAREGEDKIAVERCRLLRPLTDAELAAAGVYLIGHHETVGGTGAKWIGGSATVGCVGDSATVGYVGGSATVGYVGGSATVRSVGDSATVERVGGSATVESVGGSATVGCVGGSATVGCVGDSATVGYVGGSATVESVGDSATVERVGSIATVGCVGDSATVERVGDSATVERVGDSATVRSVGDSATVHTYDRAVVIVRWGRPTVTVRSLASALDYRGARPVHHLAAEGQVLTLAPDGSVTQAAEAT